MIEIYLLQQLVGLSEYSTLSEAAEHLHITQPTLTRSIRKLEELLGAQLFRRVKNRIYINDNGKLAVDYAKRILASEQEMIEAIQEETLKMMFNVVVKTGEEEKQRQAMLKNLAVAQKASLQSGSEKPQPVRNQEKKKVGRNDPCPCGSGKKYKKCCGRDT